MHWIQPRFRRLFNYYNNCEFKDLHKTSGRWGCIRIIRLNWWSNWQIDKGWNRCACRVCPHEWRYMRPERQQKIFDNLTNPDDNSWTVSIGSCADTGCHEHEAYEAYLQMKRQVFNQNVIPHTITWTSWTKIFNDNRLSIFRRPRTVLLVV